MPTAGAPNAASASRSSDGALIERGEERMRGRISLCSPPCQVVPCRWHSPRLAAGHRPALPGRRGAPRTGRAAHSPTSRHPGTSGRPAGCQGHRPHRSSRTWWRPSSWCDRASGHAPSARSGSRELPETAGISPPCASAAHSTVAGVYLLPVRCTGASSLITSHQTLPASARALAIHRPGAGADRAQRADGSPGRGTRAASRGSPRWAGPRRGRAPRP